MKKQKIIAIVLFCAFLAVMAAGFFVPKPAFSEMEKRYLATAPFFSGVAAQTVQSKAPGDLP